MICKVFDDWFDKRFVYDLSDRISFKLNCFHFRNIANINTWPYGTKGSHRFMGCTLFERENLNRITTLHEEAPTFFNIFERIQKNLNIGYYLKSIDINIQHSGCHGTSHIDGGDEDQTIMLMSNCEWNSEWGGKFQMLNNSGDVIEEHDYVPGRVIVFPGNVPHRGLGVDEKYPYIYRQTVVFRVQIINFV